MPPIDVVIPVRWTDLDAYGHINNAAVVRLLEEARIAAFWAPDPEQIARGAEQHDSVIGLFGVDAPLLTLIASQRLEYHLPIPYWREGALLRLWISRMGGASFDVDYRILRRDDPRAQHPYVSARTTIVVTDRGDGRARRIDGGSRELLGRFIGEPLHFRS